VNIRLRPQLGVLDGQVASSAGAAGVGKRAEYPSGEALGTYVLIGHASAASPACARPRCCRTACRPCAARGPGAARQRRRRGVFDPATISDRSSYADSTWLSADLRRVLVNGTFVVRGGDIVPGALPGRPLRARPGKRPGHDVK